MEGFAGSVNGAAKNIELAQRLATVEVASAATPTPQQVLMSSGGLLNQPAAFHGDRTTWADWALTSRAYACAVSSRRVQSAMDPLGLTHSAKWQTGQRTVVLRANAHVGHGSDFWRLLCDEDSKQC